MRQEERRRRLNALGLLEQKKDSPKQEVSTPEVPKIALRMLEPVQEAKPVAETPQENLEQKELSQHKEEISATQGVASLETSVLQVEDKKEFLDQNDKKKKKVKE